MKKIAHFGAFDHDSYGDLLFPIVAEHLWPDFAFTHVAPTDRLPAWTDARPVIGVCEAIERTDWDGILVGGGDIIQVGTWSTPKWARHLDVPFAGLPSLWAGAALLAAKLDVPLAWNAPGVPVPFPDFFAPAARAALECADYLSVRDRRSQSHLAAFSAKPIEIVADTAIAVARVWPEQARRGHVALSIAHHELRTRPDDVRQAVRRLRDRLRPDDVDVVVLPLMRWEFDPDAMAAALRDARIDARVATDCVRLEDVARWIGSARGYVGNSLHGLVTALACGVPGVLVVPTHNQTSPKYAGFLQETGVAAERHLGGAWAAAPELLLAQENVALPAAAWDRLERHRDRVRSALLTSGSGKNREWQRISLVAHAESERLALLGLPSRILPDLARRQTETLESLVAERERQLVQNAAAYEAQVRHLNEELERVNAETGAELQAVLQALADVQRKLTDIRNSKSWQITAPLRILENGLRRLHRGGLAVRHRAVCALPEGAQRALHRTYARLRPFIAVGAGAVALPFRLVQYALHPGLRAKALNALVRRWSEWRQSNRLVDLPDLAWVLEKLELNVDAGQIAARIGPYLTRREERLYGAMIGSLRAAATGAASTVVRAADLDPAGGPPPVRRRILFISGEFPNPVHGGGGRVADFIKALAVEHDVYVAAWYDPRRDRAAWMELQKHCRRLLRLSFEELEEGCVDKLLELLDGRPADVVHYEWPRALNSFDRRLGRHHVYTHMEAVSCSLWIDLHRLPPLSPDWLRRLAQLLVMLKTEILDVRQADAQIVVTAKDGEFLSRFAADQTFYVVNHGINRAEFDIPEQPAEPRSLVFTANFIHYPNVDAVHWFMQEIRPRILAAVPDLRVWLVGAHPPAKLQRYHDGAGVIVTGRVPDVRPYVQKAAVCIAPLVSGAGLRTKVVQYAALRRPCVATSIAVEDLGFENGRDVFVADAPEAFADRVVELLLDPARAAAMVASARRRALEEYDNQRIAERDLDNLYRRLDAGKEPR